MRSRASRSCRPYARPCKGGAETSRIVEQRLHIFDSPGECERADAAGLAIEGNHVLAPRRAILEHKHLPGALSAEIEQFISSAAKKTGQIEVACLERPSAKWAFAPCDGAVCS